MSRIIDFRNRVIDAVRENIKDIEEVDWYDGLFDEKDVQEWSLKTPCAFVSVNRAPAQPYMTGEINIPLNVTVVVITDDGKDERDSDEMCWKILEDLAIFAHMNTFDFEHVGAAESVVFERIVDPVMRLEGVAIGAVRWVSNLMVGPSKTAAHEFIFNPKTGQRVTQLPKDLFLGTSSQIAPDGTHVGAETLDLTEED